MKTYQKILSLLGILSILTIYNTQAQEKNANNKAALKAELAKIAAANEVISQNLAKFDTLDFVVFTKQEWERVHESHAEDILVHWPDGSTTTGIDRHIKDLSDMFVYAPDTRIEEHPIKIASGNMTAVLGVIQGTFTKPMPIGDGKFIDPTGKAYKMNMVTIGLWNEEGVMYEEYLFWDNLSFMKQLGLAQ